MMARSRLRRGETQILVLGRPIGYVTPLDEKHPEYPKFVPLPKGNAAIVNNQEEEAAVLAGAVLKRQEAPVIANNAPIKSLQGSNNEREMLLTIAHAKNIHVNARWSTGKIRKVIERATYSAESLSEWQ